MDRKQLFINWVSANKLKDITPTNLASLLENVFALYYEKNVWIIDNPEEFNNLRKILNWYRKFKKDDKKLYKLFFRNAKLYYKFLLVHEEENDENNAAINNVLKDENNDVTISSEPEEKNNETISSESKDECNEDIDGASEEENDIVMSSELEEKNNETTSSATKDENGTYIGSIPDEKINLVISGKLEDGYNINLDDGLEDKNNAVISDASESEVEETLGDEESIQYPQEQSDIETFFNNDEELSNNFYKLFLYAKKCDKRIELDVRWSIIGVKIEGERLRFYSYKNGYTKFVGIQKFAYIGNYNAEDLYSYIDDVNVFFENYQNKYLASKNENIEYIYHSRFGFGKIIDKESDLIKVKFDNIDEVKTIQAGHPSYNEISKNDYENRKNIDSNIEKPKNEISSDEQSSFKKVGWDKYETALLIEAFWKIENKEGNRIEILTQLSKSLRQKAINQGQEIDDKFRNYNGMTMQIANLAGSFFPERSSLHKTMIFEEVANLYKTDREKFNKLLEEAHKLVEPKKIELKENPVNKIDFNSNFNLRFTKPKTVTYFGNSETEFKSWVDCYKYILNHIYWDYPNTISRLANDYKYHLISNNQKSFLQPVRIVDGIFVEGNLNATSLMKNIKVILDKCDIGYENVIVEYVIKNNANKECLKNSTSIYAIKVDETDYYSYIKDDYEKKHQSDGKAYKASKYAQKCVDNIREINSLLSLNIFQIRTQEELHHIANKLSKLIIDEDKSKLFTYVIQSYYYYLLSRINAFKELNEDNDAEYDESNTNNNVGYNKSNLNNLDVSDYYSVIKSVFPDGYAFENSLRKKKFIDRYLEIVGKEFSDDDSVYDKKIYQVGFVSEGIVYLPSIVPDEVRDKIKAFIDLSLENNSLIYYSEIYEEFKDKLTSSFSELMLKKYIEFEFKDFYSLSDEFVAIKGKQINQKQMIIEAFMNCGCPLTIEELYNKFSNISHDAIDAIIRDRDFVTNVKGKSYFYKEIFTIDDSELDAIKEFISEKIQEKESVNGTELYNFINDKLPDLIESNPEVTELGFKNVLKLMLSNDFKFNGDIICAIGQNVDVSALYKNFCKQREKFTLSEIEEFKDSINQHNIYWSDVFSIMVRINENTFIRRDFINFDVEKIDNAIGSYCVNDYIGFNDIINYTEFPPIGYPWNNYVLESYVFFNSKNFKLIHACFNRNKPVGGIVKSNSNINDLDDLIIKIIKSGKLFNKENAFNFLIENDFIRVKKVKNIDFLIEKAKKEG